jgi:hypothetical protein
MTLTARQRVAVNAALAIIYDKDHDAKGVIQQANTLIAQGKDPASAYEAALNSFVDGQPSLMPAISHMFRLVEASDDKTVDQYDAALDTYLHTGDEMALRDLAPTIAQDSLALAVRDGEITQEEAANGELAKALGFQPGEALVQVVADGKHVPEPQPEAAPQQFQFSDKATAPKIEQAPPPSDYGSQQSVGGSAIPVTGMVAPKAAQLWARDAAAREAVAAQTEGAQSL